MVPAGYMAKRVEKRLDWLHVEHVVDIYSVSGCNSEDFADYIDYWKHNGYWLFDSPEIILEVAREESVSLVGTKLFYYEIHEMEFDRNNWNPYIPENSFVTNVSIPIRKRLEGFDIVTFFAKNRAECSPLSCNSFAEKVATNSHCLFNSFEEAESHLNAGTFTNSEPGPYRIFAVYSVDWPVSMNERN